MTFSDSEIDQNELDNQIKSLPNVAGVYKFFNSSNDLIYVGKAKDLKKRVSSYFTNKSQHNRKTYKLVIEVAYLEYIVVNSEFDALLLENNLIKENQPKYNILLKDDKSFPHIIVTNEPFPRVFSTRRIIKGKGEYFGPYASVKMMNNLLDLIRKLYTIRTCKLDLTEKNIKDNKFKVCLEYHIGNCLGPCEALQSIEDYSKEIDQVKYILKGNLTQVRSHFKESMNIASQSLHFERAQVFKNKLEMLDKFQSKSIIVNLKIPDSDVLTIVSEEKKAFLNYMKIENGILNATETFEVSKKLEESDEEILTLVLFNIRNKYKSTNNIIICNKEIESYSSDIEIVHPKIGDKKKLIDLSLKNILFYQKNKSETTEQKIDTEQRRLQQLQIDLKLKALPKQIECFDNSNLQGTNPVASMVCFINGKPAKKEYRHFKIKTVVGPDDFSSMKEIVSRRYKRLIKENKDLPNLIVIDGGKGQLNAAVSALKELNVYGYIPIIGIAKKLEEIYFPEDEYPLHINKKSESLKLIQHLRNEAHRFAITFHRDLRSKAAIKSALEEIPGLGSKTVEKVLSKFKSVEILKKTDPIEIVKLIGNRKGKILSEWIKKGEH